MLEICRRLFWESRAERSRYVGAPTRGLTMDEAQNRQELIDERLRHAGWDVHDASQAIQELDIHLAEVAVGTDPTNPRSSHGIDEDSLREEVDTDQTRKRGHGNGDSGRHAGSTP